MVQFLSENSVVFNISSFYLHKRCKDKEKGGLLTRSAGPPLQRSYRLKQVVSSVRNSWSEVETGFPPRQTIQTSRATIRNIPFCSLLRQSLSKHVIRCLREKETLHCAVGLKSFNPYDGQLTSKAQAEQTQLQLKNTQPWPKPISWKVVISGPQAPPNAAFLHKGHRLGEEARAGCHPPHYIYLSKRLTPETSLECLQCEQI